MLCCVVLCCVVLCYDMLYYVRYAKHVCMMICWGDGSISYDPLLQTVFRVFVDRVGCNAGIWAEGLAESRVSDFWTDLALRAQSLGCRVR